MTAKRPDENPSSATEMIPDPPCRPIMRSLSFAGRPEGVAGTALLLFFPESVESILASKEPASISRINARFSPFAVPFSRSTGRRFQRAQT